MKTLPLLSFFLFSFLFVTAQDIDNNTYAVVVGISDYQDENIPDLQFAHRDAEAFAEFLKSQAGGNAPDKNIQLLTNKNAKMANVMAALDNLISQAKIGDKAIFYFAGYGDVEAKMKQQKGYLLCSDAPAKIYMAGGTLQIQLINDVFVTLEEAGVQVIFIGDVLRASNLSGSPIDGPSITARNLAKQHRNEIKILSCLPEEYSLEGEQWGGGHSAFNHYLIKGLSGEADKDRDANITISEIGSYLQKAVPKATQPIKQTPMIIGDESILIVKSN